MKVKDLVEKLGLKPVASTTNLESEVKNGFVGDLLSIVMGKAKQGCAWITIQSHINIVAVAALVDVACIIVTEGFEVEKDAIEKAEEEGVVILTSPKSSYEVATELFLLGIL